MPVDPESGLTPADDTPTPPDAIVLDDAGLISPQEVGRRHRQKRRDAARAAAIEAGYVPPPALATEVEPNSPAGAIVLPTGYRVEWAAVRVRTGADTVTYRRGEVVPASAPPDEIGRLTALEAVVPHFGPLPDRAIVLAGTGA